MITHHTTIHRIGHFDFEIEFTHELEPDIDIDTVEIVRICTDKRVNGKLENIDVTPEVIGAIGYNREFTICEELHERLHNDDL